MITIIHGDDITASRNFLLEQKKRIKDAKTFAGDSVTLTDLVQAIEGQGLFEENSSLFIEELITKKKGKDFDEISNYLVKKSKNADFFIWEKRELTKKQTALFDKAQIQLFSYPKILFQFLENIKPRNPQILTLFHELLKQSEIEIIVFMIIRQFRLLIAVLDKSDNSIDEISRLAPWQESRLKQQARLFSQESLIKAYKRLFEIDLGAKTGTLPYPLTTAIDFFLIDL